MVKKREWRIRMMHPQKGETTLDYVDLEHPPKIGEVLKLQIDKAEKSFSIIGVNEMIEVITVEPC